jgi:vitamin B12 transporter
MSTRVWSRSIVTLAVWMVMAVLSPAWLSAQPSVVTGVVTDESGGAINAVSITVRNAAGSIAQTTTTDAIGAFSVSGLTPGRYAIEAESPLFARTEVTLDLSDGRAPSVVRLTMKIGGLVESMVVTGRRVETRLSETPQKIEVVDARDIERSVAADITDVLKKNSGVDVVQYTGGLSGIGIRGFRPETSGINKRSLLLVDGRPSGVTNLSTLLLDNVDHIEVLKGPASAVYGASAMGGVVNIITRQSRGPVAGNGRVAFGSFNSSELGGRAGGSLTPRLDFDVTGSIFNQRDDIRMGNGAVRPATTYKTYDGSARLGADVAKAWRLDGRVNAYRGRDISTPGDVFNGVASQGRKNLEHASGDVRLSGQIARHLVSATAYAAGEQNHTTNVTSSNPLDQGFLPYLSFENDLGWSGAQLKDAWGWSRANNLLVGLDYERVSSNSKSYLRTRAPQAPFSADSRKNTVGVYAENTVNVNQGRTVVSLGGRLDRIEVKTVDTPLKTNFMPSTTTFTIFNPSVGIKQEIVRGLRAHATAGRAFVPADASALTGFTTNIVGGRTQINQGNPDLKPEHSVSFDGGLELSTTATHLDVTYFQTAVKDRVVSNVPLVTPAPPPPAPIVLTAVNTLASHIYGMDVDFAHRVNPALSVFSNVTHYFSRREQLPTTGERNILNVPSNTVRAGLDVDWRRLSSRLSARYVQGRQDQDFNVPASPVVDYPNFTVVDLSTTYQVHAQHAVVLTVNNLTDTFYYEKRGYPLQGASFMIKYRIGR